MDANIPLPSPAQPPPYGPGQTSFSSWIHRLASERNVPLDRPLYTLSRDVLAWREEHLQSFAAGEVHGIQTYRQLQAMLPDAHEPQLPVRCPCCGELLIRVNGNHG